MKIRIKGNSIRFRLTRSEVATFCKKGCIDESTAFTGTTFVYGLQMDSDVAELSAKFRDNTITLYVPEKLVIGWDNDKRVGFENSVSLENGDALHLLLEKDFVCMDDRGEDESDHYPNPKMAK